jgi:neutral ceramidase
MAHFPELGGKRTMSDTQLLVGFGVADITPPLGLAMSGGLEPRTNVGIGDPLLAKALVAEAGGRKLAIVGVDLLGLPRVLVDPIIAQASRQTGIPADAILIVCSHTHSGPYPFEGVYSYNVTNADYMASIPGKIADSIAQALSSRKPARMTIGRAMVHHGLHHRRVICKDGKVFNTWMPGALDDLTVCPQVLGAAGPIDPEMWVARFDDSAGRPFGAFINFPLHVNSRGGTLWSADYPSVIASRMTEAFGPGFATVFTPGACANVNPTLGGERYWRQGADYFADQAIAAAKRAIPIQGPVRVDVVRRDVSVPRRDPASQPPDAIARLHWGSGGGRPDVFEPQLTRVAAMPQQLSVPVSAARIGPLAIATNGGELFVEYGLDIKARSPFPYTVVTELTNDEIGYQPTEDAFARQGYETLVGANWVALDGIRKLIDTDVELLQELWKRS